MALGLVISVLPLCSRTTISSPPVFRGFDALTREGSAGEVIFIGDTQGTGSFEKVFLGREDNHDKTPLLIKEIARYKPACVLNLGDLVFRGTSRRQWEYFDAIHRPLREAGIPCFPIPGNHEYQCRPAKSFENYFARFPQLNGRKWYSFTFQKTGFVMLDGNLCDLRRAEKESQDIWYRQELRRMNGDPGILRIIVGCHFPPFTNSEIVHPDAGVETQFVPAFLDSPKAVVFFSGHCHSYEKFEKRGKYFIVSGGGGGPRQKLRTAGEGRRFNDLYDGGSLRFLHFCRMIIEPRRLVFQVVKLTEAGGFEPADTFEVPNPRWE